MARNRNMFGFRMTLIISAIISGFIWTNTVSGQADFLSFNFDLDPSYSEVINTSDHTVDVEVYNTADVTDLVAIFTVSQGAVVRVNGVIQTSGVTANDFSSALTYQITSDDGSVVTNWTVQVTKRTISNEKVLKSFRFPDIPDAEGTISTVDYTVRVPVPYSQDVSSLVATFTASDLATVFIGGVEQVSGVTVNDFSQAVAGSANYNPMPYNVIAENGSNRVFYVTLDRDEPNTDNDLLTFSFAGLNPTVSGAIDQGSHTVSLTVPYETDVTGLVATFTHSYLSTVTVGGVEQVSGQTPNNFTNPVDYNVIAESGASQVYTVTVDLEDPSTEKQLLSYSLTNLQPTVSGSIDQTNHTVTLTIPHAADITDLVASFSVSPFATVLIGTTPQVSGTTTNDFSQPLVYTVKAQDGSTQNYTVTVNQTPASTDNDLIAFSFDKAHNPTLPHNITGEINQSNHTVALTIPYGPSLTALKPTFSISPLATAWIDGVQQVSTQTAGDYSDAVTFQVKAEDNSTQNYTITTTQSAASQENQLISFEFRAFDNAGLSQNYSAEIDEVDKTVAVSLPYDADPTALVATFEISAYATASVGGTAQVSGSTTNDFSEEVVYAIEAQDGSTELYYVTVTLSVNDEKDFLTYSFLSSLNNSLPSDRGATIDATAGTITISVPHQTDISALIASFTVSDMATVYLNGVTQVSGVTANNFTTQITYLVEAQDETTKQWVVNLTRDPNTEKKITAFSFENLSPVVQGDINETQKTITAVVPFSANLQSLAPSFTLSDQAYVSVNGVIQESGVSVIDFTNPVVYKVTAEDGSTQDYLVTVTKAEPSSEKQVLSFGFMASLNAAIDVDVNAEINDDLRRIRVEVPFGTQISSLIASFSLSNFATAYVGRTMQVSGETENDFSYGLIYEIVAEDETTRQYSVIVTIAPNTEKLLTDFRFNQFSPAAIAQIDQTLHTVVVEIPYGADQTNLIASFTVSANATLSLNGVAQVSGYTANDYSDPMVFTVTAEDESIQDYVVTVFHTDPSAENSLLTFQFETDYNAALAMDYSGTISHESGSVVVHLPYGSDPSDLIASFTLSEFAVAEIAGVPQVSTVSGNDFSSDVVYDVIAQDGTTKQYTIEVIVDPNTEKKILSFTFEQFSPPVVGTIDEATYTVNLAVPHGSDLTTLVATFELSDQALASVNGVVQVSGETVNDFTNPLIYSIIADDGTTQEYHVVVTVNPDTDPPVVTAAAQNVTNEEGQYVVVQTSESSGKVYIIKFDVDQSSLADLELAVASQNGNSNEVTAANQDIQISTHHLRGATYYAYAVDAAGNISEKGVHPIVVTDKIAPEVTMTNQTVINGPDNYVVARSSETGSFLYLILEEMDQSTVEDLERAVSIHKGIKSIVDQKNTDVRLPVAGLHPGSYHAYAVDRSDNMSDPSIAIVTVEAANQSKEVTSFTFLGFTPSPIAQISDDQIRIDLPVGTDVTSLVAVFALSEKARAYVGLVEQVSGVTPNDFTHPLPYIIEAEDGSTREYLVIVTLGGSGIPQVEWMNAIRVYPVPTDNYLQIDMDYLPDRLIITDLNGKVIWDHQHPDSFSQSIDASGWQAGIYLLQCIQSDQLVYYKKILKQ